MPKKIDLRDWTILLNAVMQAEEDLRSRQSMRAAMDPVEAGDCTEANAEISRIMANVKKFTAK
jgi:hypothetical protein